MEPNFAHAHFAFHLILSMKMFLCNGLIQKNPNQEADQHGEGKRRQLYKKLSTAAIKWRGKETSLIPFLFYISFHYRCSVRVSVLTLNRLCKNMSICHTKVALTKLFLARESQLSWPSEELKQVQCRFSFLHVARYCQRRLVSCVKS